MLMPPLHSEVRISPCRVATCPMHPLNRSLACLPPSPSCCLRCSDVLAAEQSASSPSEAVIPQLTVRLTSNIDKTLFVGPEFLARYK